MVKFFHHCHFPIALHLRLMCVQLHSSKRLSIPTTGAHKCIFIAEFSECYSLSASQLSSSLF